jgi:hypothetical protein
MPEAEAVGIIESRLRSSPIKFKAAQQLNKVLRT